MVLAVVDADAQVLQCEARDGAFGQHLPHAFLDGRDELARDHAADHVVDELEARAALERLDAQVHLAELAGAAGLLLVAAMAFGRSRDRLAVRHARRARLDRDAVAIGDPLQHDPQVQVAEAVQHGLVLRRVVLDAHARVFGRQPVQAFRELLFVAALLGADREAEHRRRERDRLQVEVVLVVRVVQHGVEVDLVDLRHRADVARHRLCDLDVLLALQLEQVRDLDGLAAIADEQRRAGLHGALVHAEDAELADERVDRDLEDVRDARASPDPGSTVTRSAASPSPFRNGGGLPSAGFGASRASTCSSSGMPAPVSAEQKQIGTR